MLFIQNRKKIRRGFGCNRNSRTNDRYVEDKTVVTEPLINIQYLSLCNCLRYPVIGTYYLLSWVVLHDERISRDKKNVINMSLFLLVFVYSLCVYCCFNSLLSLIEYILLVDNKALRFETYCKRTH